MYNIISGIGFKVLQQIKWRKEMKKKGKMLITVEFSDEVFLI